MIRTAFALLFVVAASTLAHASLPAAQNAAAGKATTFAGCVVAKPATCGERLVTRGHADLAPRYVAPRTVASIATA